MTADGEAADDDAPAPEVIDDALIFDDSKRRFWFFGAAWCGQAEGQTDRFVEEAIWQNG